MTRLYRNEEVLWREEDEALAEAREKLAGDDEEAADIGTSILFTGGQIVSLNVLGTEIWKLCDGRTVDEVVGALMEQFEVEPDVLRTDVDAFLADLVGKGLIRYAD